MHLVVSPVTGFGELLLFGKPKPDISSDSCRRWQFTLLAIMRGGKRVMPVTMCQRQAALRQRQAKKNRFVSFAFGLRQFLSGFDLVALCCASPPCCCDIVFFFKKDFEDFYFIGPSVCANLAGGQ